MRQWFFDNIESFQAEVGFETSFIIQSGERTFTTLWKVREVIPFRKISYNWSYEEYSGDGYIMFEIFEKEEETQLRLTDIITKNYPNDIP